jgi:hypothetical protein
VEAEGGSSPLKNVLQWMSEQEYSLPVQEGLWMELERQGVARDGDLRQVSKGLNPGSESFVSSLSFGRVFMLALENLSRDMIEGNPHLKVYLPASSGSWKDAFLIFA